MQKHLLILFFAIPFINFAQSNDSIVFKNGIDNPNMQTTHHFGIFSSRIQQNFKREPNRQTLLSLNYASGNNFQPFVETHLPSDPDVREELSQLIWFQRQFEFIDQETTPAEYYNIVIDAVIKEFRVDLTFPIAKKHELGINLRSYLITDGSYPFSFFTSDKTIEWFHSNIAGGEDPFGRRFYGLNQVDFRYEDRNGNVLKLDKNDFFIGGLELNHHYYPTFGFNETRNLYFNFGSHLGINLSKFNPSVDIGVSINALKQFKFKNNNELDVAAGASVLRKNVIDFDEVIDLGNNPFLATFEADVEFTKYTQKGNYNAFGLNYQIQSRYNKKVETEYYRLLGNFRDINAGWHNGVSRLYVPLSNWSLIYTYGRERYKLSLYVKQDFSVNNAPDIQTGINFKIPVGN
ncbi:MAG: hypothetical protein ED556_00080 [Winogradskyella sp.]|uniref:hypothetical protein n=1 Tax=Winogradskyella sp. TaxID=1883156 RepID=UPI000F40DC0E|nr:hypothetical protein [Winogradskyella sp.]RNC87625.1 MAG: hypothetical protein ED556_00080 [Winogradskyella sp.]